MIKKSFFAILIVMVLLVSICGLTVSAAQKLSPKVKQLADYAKELESGKAIDTYSQLSSKERDELAVYLEANSQNFPPLFFMIMADHVYKSDKDKALEWYYIGKIRSYEDVYMCKDKTAQAQVSQYPKLAPKTLRYLSTKLQDKKYIAKILKKALDWDISHSDRIDPVWACYHGLSAFSQEPELIDQKKRSDVYKKFRKEMQDMINKYNK